MRRPIILALAMVLLSAAGVAPTSAQEPTRVCTEVVVPEDSPVAGMDVLRGQPPDGECDVIVYLPMVLLDVGMMAGLVGRAEDVDIAAGELCVTPASLVSAGGEVVPCDELAE